MTDFAYTARDSKGNAITGKRTASSEEELALQLQAEQLIPIEISLVTQAQKQKPKALALKKRFQSKVALDELQIFCRQMYTVLKAGVPIAVAVSKLAESTRDKQLAIGLQGILDSLNQGNTLYTAMARFPAIFNEFFINLIQVGESTGQLDMIFLHLAEYIELETDTRKKVKTALRYPIIVLVATLVAVLVINGFVIPSFSQMFKNFHGQLPLITRILIETSNFIVHCWYLVLGAGFLGLQVLRYYIRTPLGQLQWSRLQIKIPLIGWLIHRIILARFARLYALALRSGLTAVDAINLVGSSTGNAFVAKKIHLISELVARGNSIASSIAQTKLFPPLVLQMISLGEETGSIDDLLDEVAAFYQREINYDLDRLSDAIEPILLGVMGILVLLLALGVFLPMWDIASQMQP